MKMKKCTKCGERKIINDFYKWNRGKDGHAPHCKKCHNKYYEAKTYKNMNRLRMANRTAIKKALPHTLTNSEWKSLLTRFEGKCVLSGSEFDVEIEHVIPMATGHGGTTIKNVVPVNKSVNISKRANNIFEWVESQPIEIQKNFYEIELPYIAEQNGMSPNEYRDFVFWCFRHPRTVAEIKIDNARGMIHSCDLFYEYIELNYVPI